jgi:hypothetical protein
MASPLLDASEPSDLSEVEQRRFEMRLNRQAAVQNLHNSFGHPNNLALLQHCQYAKIGTKYLKRYILSFECAFCQAALGRRSYIKRKRAALPPSTDTTPLPPSTPTIVPDVFLHPFKGDEQDGELSSADEAPPLAQLVSARKKSDVKVTTKTPAKTLVISRVYTNLRGKGMPRRCSNARPRAVPRRSPMTSRRHLR